MSSMGRSGAFGDESVEGFSNRLKGGGRSIMNAIETFRRDRGMKRSDRADGNHNILRHVQVPGEAVRYTPFNEAWLRSHYFEREQTARAPVLVVEPAARSLQNHIYTYMHLRTGKK